MFPTCRTDDVLPWETDLRIPGIREKTHLIPAVETRDDQLVALRQLPRIREVEIHKMVSEVEAVGLKELTVQRIHIR